MNLKLKELFTQILSVAIQSTVTYYYFTFFGVSWYSIVPFFTSIAFMRLAIGGDKK